MKRSKAIKRGKLMPLTLERGEGGSGGRMGGGRQGGREGKKEKRKKKTRGTLADAGVEAGERGGARREREIPDSPSVPVGGAWRDGTDRPSVAPDSAASAPRGSPHLMLPPASPPVLLLFLLLPFLLHLLPPRLKLLASCLSLSLLPVDTAEY